MNNTFTALNRSLEQNNYNYNLPIKNNNKEPTFISKPYIELNYSQLQEPAPIIQQMLIQDTAPIINQEQDTAPIINQEQVTLPNINQEQVISQIKNQEQEIAQIINKVQEITQIINQVQQPLQNITQSQQPFQNINQVQQPLQNIIQSQQPFQNINQVQQPLQNIIQSQQQLPIEDGLPDIECNKRIDIIKKDLSYSIAKYIDLLCEELLNNEIISLNEIQNIKYKIKNNQVDINTIINYLENKKMLNRQISISGNNKSFDNILSGKWQVPMPRPPVCLPSEITKVNQYDTNTTNFSSF